MLNYLVNINNKITYYINMFFSIVNNTDINYICNGFCKTCINSGSDFSVKLHRNI